ncbi:hypothetical protein LMG27198_24820 [Methylocystis echinoides]|uniref:Uncharacterized protein n=1 Tax=Methylocystis echinoides TaxID=29468 RepID=A0A9W6GV60_9HYPH|nr:hypothetical protein LMG27198_24820 [Methylocystis echinoides]
MGWRREGICDWAIRGTRSLPTLSLLAKTPFGEEGQGEGICALTAPAIPARAAATARAMFPQAPARR